MTQYDHRFNGMRRECRKRFVRSQKLIWSTTFGQSVQDNPDFQAIKTVAKVTSYGHNNRDFRNTDHRGNDVLRSGFLKDFPK
ncbi:hypothetical protein L5515_012156 [Caenorhabditis briggsae]|uniref:Uncharacterized protein n=1 Tax=Caenorhabditis briggsae TaxID=6238 RepID=A0AAE9EWT0_CAEBR|nr:hypothetical protein L5515_012156 [Caenorhabditis briggsae]